MKPTRLLSILLCSGSLLAQTGLDVSLAPDGSYARDTDVITVKLDITAKSEAELPAGLLMGQGLQFSVDGKNVGKASSSRKKIKVAKGAKLSLEIPVSLAAVFGKTKNRPKIGKSVKLGISLPGVEASTSLTVVSDLQSLSNGVNDLDLQKSRVAIVTNFGTMVVSFRPDKAPNHVKNFLKLSLTKFYDGTRFHRVMKGFMIQGGDPNTKNDDPSDDGQGGPGWTIDAEFNDIPHTKGVLSMARSASPNSAGSQFFLMDGTAQGLDGQYTVFGKVVEGVGVIDRICDVPVGFNRSGTEQSVPKKPVKLIRAVVLGVEKG